MEQFSSQPLLSGIVWMQVKRILLQKDLALTLCGYAEV